MGGNRRGLLVALVGLLSVAVFFRFQILLGLARTFGDINDGFIEIAILEHWNNVFHGREHWSEVAYFFPVKGSLGYNDGYFLYGAIHALFRTSGFDVFVSAEGVNLVVRSIGYAAFYAACRRLLDLDWRWAMVGAVVFTLSNNAFIHVGHAQLLGVSFAPLFALLLHGLMTSLQAKKRLPVLGWGAALVSLFAAWLMTGFYMAWYCGLFGLFTLLFLAIFSAPADRAALLRGIWRHAPLLLAVVLLFAAESLPFLSLYVPKARETGMYDYKAVLLYFSPSLLDVVHIGPANWLFGWWDEAIARFFRPDYPRYSEHTTGFPPVILIVFAASLIWLCRNGRVLLCALAMATVTSWAMFLHYGPFTAYSLIYGLIPGAKAVRVMARYQTFLAAPLIALAMAFLAAQTGKWPRLVLAGLALLLVAEEINLGPPLGIDRKEQLARLAAVPAPPAECGAFYVTRADAAYLHPDVPTEGLYRHSADAMLLAELLHIPTINGYASLQPPDYYLFFPDDPEYGNRIRRYVERYEVKDLCALDLTAKVWAR